MAEDFEIGKRISELDYYRGGFPQAVIDNAMLPVAIGIATNARIGAAEISNYIDQTVTTKISNALDGLAEAEDLQRLSDDFESHVRNGEVHITTNDRARWDGKQDRLTAGSNIKINGTTISATVTAGAPGKDGNRVLAITEAITWEVFQTLAVGDLIINTSDGYLSVQRPEPWFMLPGDVVEKTGENELTARGNLLGKGETGATGANGKSIYAFTAAVTYATFQTYAIGDLLVNTSSGALNIGTNTSANTSAASGAVYEKTGANAVTARGNILGPTGSAGQKGDTGAAATVSVGTTTTGNAGTNASVTNSGTSSAAVLNFTIPKGATGETGATGANGQGVPTGGTTGQVLTKTSNSDFATQWSNPSGGGSGNTINSDTTATVRKFIFQASVANGRENFTGIIQVYNASSTASNSKTNLIGTLYLMIPYTLGNTWDIDATWVGLNNSTEIYYKKTGSGTSLTAIDFFLVRESLTQNAQVYNTKVEIMAGSMGASTILFPSTKPTLSSGDANAVLIPKISGGSGGSVADATTSSKGIIQLAGDLAGTAASPELAAVSRSNTTSTDSPAAGSSFTAIDSLTSDSKGRVTAVNTKTVTLPAGGGGSGGIAAAVDKGSVDFNTLTTTGFYRVTGGTNAPNTSGTTAWNVAVFQGGANSVIQIAKYYSNTYPSVYIRTAYSNSSTFSSGAASGTLTWSSWSQLGSGGGSTVTLDASDINASNIDPDTYTTSGIYYGGWKIPTSSSNTYGYLEVHQLSGNANYAIQTFRTEIQNTEVYIRTRYNGTWGDWKELDSGDGVITGTSDSYQTIDTGVTQPALISSRVRHVNMWLTASSSGNSSPLVITTSLLDLRLSANTERTLYWPSGRCLTVVSRPKSGSTGSYPSNSITNNIFLRYFTMTALASTSNYNEAFPLDSSSYLEIRTTAIANGNPQTSAWASIRAVMLIKLSSVKISTANMSQGYSYDGGKAITIFGALCYAG